MNRHYIVRLRLFVGGYEKSSTMLVTATCPEHAGAAALHAESHNPTLLEWDGMARVTDDDMAYTLECCDEVDVQAADLLAHYLPCADYVGRELALSGNFTNQEVKL